MNKARNIFIKIILTLIISWLPFQNFLTENISAQPLPVITQEAVHQKAPSVPEGEYYVEVNDNIPLFTDEELSSLEVFVEFGPLDEIGRVTTANALLGVELMPSEDRESIAHIFPTGWNQKRYVNVSGGWLYNRSHLMGYQLVGDNADPQNLMTGTRWFNVEGMLPFENFVANFIESTESLVRYRVTPLFEADNLLASGAFMEGFSVEDNGGGLQFHIYVPNIQPGVELNYKNGESIGPSGPLPASETELDDSSPKQKIEQIPKIKEKLPLQPKEKIPLQSEEEEDISSIDLDGNGQVTIKEAKKAGFTMPIMADHWLYPYMIDGDGDGMVGE